MRVRWTVPAVDDLESIKNYLQQHHPHFAEPTVRAIYQRIRSLKATPYRGRPGHRSGTRELPLTPLPYVVVYSVNPEAAEILHIHHGRKTGAECGISDSPKREG
jgi:toxin ParE1/3/4